MEDVAIVDARPEDAEGLARVQKATWLSTYPSAELGISQADLLSKDFDSPKKIASIRQRLSDQSTDRTWVAKAGDQVVAFCIAGRHDDANTIEALYVLPRYQGYRIGYRLLAGAVEWLGDAREIRVQAASYNHKAINFYRDFGFEPAQDSIEDYALPNGKAVPQISLIRPAEV